MSIDKLFKGVDLKSIRKLAKQLDTPELRELYRKQQLENKGFNEMVDELSEEIEDLFKHDKDS